MIIQTCSSHWIPSCTHSCFSLFGSISYNYNSSRKTAQSSENQIDSSYKVNNQGEKDSSSLLFQYSTMDSIRSKCEWTNNRERRGFITGAYGSSCSLFSFGTEWCGSYHMGIRPSIQTPHSHCIPPPSPYNLSLSHSVSLCNDDSSCHLPSIFRLQETNRD